MSVLCPKRPACALTFESHDYRDKPLLMLQGVAACADKTVLLELRIDKKSWSEEACSLPAGTRTQP